MIEAAVDCYLQARMEVPNLGPNTDKLVSIYTQGIGFVRRYVSDVHPVIKT